MFRFLRFLVIPFLVLAYSCCSPLPDALSHEEPYEAWVAGLVRYPRTMEIYLNRGLAAQADETSKVHICLSQQRGRLYVQGQVAADWPVSTGTDEHPTPTGSFRVMEKERDYRSVTWGKILDAEGKCVVPDADSRVDIVPEGGQFVGSSMPYWQRLTHTGIGMHTGKVRAGRKLSHGCIRTPALMARELFKITRLHRTVVIIAEEQESCYPAILPQVQD